MIKGILICPKGQSLVGNTWVELHPNCSWPCTLYETALLLLAKGVFPPQIAPGTDSLQHTVHLLLRHKNTSNNKNMKLAWSFPHFCVPQPPSPNSMLSTPSEVLLDTLA